VIWRCAARRWLVGVWIAFVAVGGIGGCSGERDFEIQVQFEGRPLRDVRVIDLADERELGHTSIDGRAVLRLPSKLPTPIRIRLEAPPDEKSIRFDSQYTIDSSVLAQGILPIAALPAAAADAPARLAVTSVPPGLEIWLDGVSIGVTPLESGDLEPNRPVKLEARRNGRTVEAVDLFLVSGSQPYEFKGRAEAEVGAESQARRGSRGTTSPGTERGGDRSMKNTRTEDGPRVFHTYSISTSPSVAEVYLDGGREDLNSLGRFRAKLAEGPHVFRVVDRASSREVLFRYVVPRDEDKKILVLSLTTEKITLR